MRSVVDLCSGTGGFSVAGVGRFHPVYANDKDPDSKVIYEANHPTVTLDCRPLGEVPLTALPAPGTVELITAGFPCQPYSKAGQLLGLADPRSVVFEDILRVTRHLQPRWLVCENVANLARMEEGAVWTAVQATAQRYLPGWRCSWTVYDTATHSGIPQHRERMYMVWFRDLDDALRFRFKVPRPPVRHVSTLLERSVVPDKYYFDGRVGRVAEALVRGCLQPVLTTGAVYQRRPDMSVRMNRSGLVPALTANMGRSSYSGPVIRDARGVRKFTPRECFAAQGFPESYQLAELCDTSLYRLVGNAVSVPIAKLVLDALAELG